MMDKNRITDKDTFHLLSTILNYLNAAVFWRVHEDYFSPIYKLPDWLEKLQAYQSIEHPLSEFSAEIKLGDIFPFIENFLFDCEQFWRNPDRDSLRSGLWTEKISDSDELYLEVIAMKIGDYEILIIANETANFDIRHKVFQNARNLALKNEQLENSIYLHQRELQQHLENAYSQEFPIDQLSKDIEEETSAVMICCQDGNVEIYNRALIDIYSMSSDDELKRESLLDKWIGEAEKQYPEIHRVIQSGSHWEGEFESTDTNNVKKWVRLMIAPVAGDNDKVSHYICIANDISNIKLSISEIERLTQVDPNTRLPNRRNFWSYLSDQISKHQQSGESLALFYVDIDHFKQVNDDLGPKQADFLLNAVANRLKRSLKKQDYIAHLGGDEFAVVVNNFSDQHSLASIAQRIMDNIYRDVSFGDFTLNVSASIGIAIYPQHGLKARLLVKNADYAMYHAKEMGRNQFQFSSPYSKRRIKRKIHIEQGLKSALNNNEFELLYQPQISIGESVVHRIEALIRWHHPEHGLITPTDFISIAEESGIIIDIGKWVLNNACEEINRLNQSGFNVKMSVNVSPKQFKYSNLTKDVYNTLKQFEIRPSQLELEITESILLEELDVVIEQLNALRNLGVTISLDDFGTGYSSLSYLKKIPINILKIDRSFIHELPHNQHSRTIVESIISMAHQLSIQVVAEGIENHSQYDYLKRLNCDYLQGFLFHAPLKKDELLELYRSLKPKV